MKRKNKILFASVLLLFSLITVINVQAQANATNTPPAITGINVEKIISINPDGSSSASLIEAVQNGGTVAVEKDARIDLFIKFKDYDGVGNFTEATLYSPAGNLVCLAKDAVYNPNADAYSCNESTPESLRGFLVSKEGFGTYSGNVCDAVNSCTPVRITLTEKASGGTGGGGSGVIVQPPSGGGGSGGGGSADTCTKYYTCPDGTQVKECELTAVTSCAGSGTTTSCGGGGGCRCTTNPASLCPIAKDFHLGVTADKYTYALGEQAKITAILSSPYAGMNFESAAVAAHVSTSFARTSACPLNTACGGSVASYPIDMKPVGWIAEACTVSPDGTTTCPVVQKYQYMFVGSFDILSSYASGGYTISSTANLNGVGQQASSTFEVIPGEQPYVGGVSISLEPTEQKTVVGEPATYIIRVTDKHNVRACTPCALKDDACLAKCSSQYYTYNIEIFGLPYSSTYDRQVTVPVGGTGETKLIVYPSSTTIQQTVAQNVTLEQPATGVVASPTTTTAVAQKAVAVQPVRATATIVATTQTSAEEAKQMVVSGKAERATATVQKTTTEPAARVVSGAGATQVETTKESIIRFTVRAAQADNQNVADKATGVLIVRFIEIPKPPITPPDLPDGEVVTINIEKGWNLINLPGDYTSTKSSCKKYLTGFVYIDSQKKYVNIEGAQKILGNDFKNYIATHSFWIYARESCELTTMVSNFATYSGLNLNRGWNFLGTTKDMVGETLSSIKGTCEFEKIYTFGTSGNKWEAFSANNLITAPYKGMVVKTKNACTLSGNVILSPPSLPE